VVICPSNIERAWSSHDGVMNDKPISYYLPDYLNDLNAMHEAEKVLDYNQLREMEDSVSFQFAVYPFHATAPQRAEAFLRTLELWKPTPTQPQ
jgi:hypothetical protein